MQEETSLFEIRFTEQGKKFICKFVAISYTIFVLVLFEAAISIFWIVNMLIKRNVETESSLGFGNTYYDNIYPYISVLISLMAVVSNFYYIRFPRVLLRSIELNDEDGANRSFGLLFKGAMIFLVWMLIITANMVWNLSIR